MNRNRELKLALIAKNPVCHWCGIEVIDHVAKDFESVPDNTATIDHLVNRRYRKRGEVVEKVLACSRCNSKKDTEDSKYMNPLRVHARLNAEAIKAAIGA